MFILGIATLIADAISMALGDYLSSKSENDFYVSERQREAWEVTNNPEGEKLEMIELYKVIIIVNNLIVKRYRCRGCSCNCRNPF